MQIYVNKIENRITFKSKSGYSLKPLTPETMKLLGSTRNKITEDKNGQNVLHLETTEIVLVHRDIVNNNDQEYSRVLYIFVPNEPFGNLLGISLTNHIFLKTFYSEYSKTIVWLTDQNSILLQIEDRINLTMVIK